MYDYFEKCTLEKRSLKEFILLSENRDKFLDKFLKVSGRRICVKV